MARGEHDRPDPSLIVEGSRRVHRSKRVQGQDYPITPLEELRLKGIQPSPSATYIRSENTLIGNATTGGNTSSGSNGHIPEVTLTSYQQNLRETPSGDATRGDAVREDGTLKDADEMVWLHSPSDEHKHSVNHGEDMLEWPESPSTSGEYNSTLNSGSKRQESNESGSEEDNIPKAMVS
jgi:hypothetical protein